MRGVKPIVGDAGAEPVFSRPDLAARIAARIAREGPIGFDRFMEMALYDQEEGYYASGRAAIGRGGDFFTSASVGPLFGRLLAQQLGELGAALGGEWGLVEQGAFDGRLAADILDAGCRPPAGLALLEPFPAFEARQRAKLAGREGVRWAVSPGDLSPFRGIHYSNELADAFPVRRFVFRSGFWREKRVALEDRRFIWHEVPARGGEDLPEEALEGDEIERAAGMGPWLEGIGRAMSEGYLLLLDYGDWERRKAPGDPIRSALACYRGHVRGDRPLDDPGGWDITARVDFSRLARLAGGAGFRLVGAADQHHFMVGLGVTLFREEEARETGWDRTVRQFKTLMHPEMMGSGFHALLFAKGEVPDGPFSGWSDRGMAARRGG